MSQAKYKEVLLIDDDWLVNRVNEKIIKGVNFAQKVTIKDSAETALAYVKETFEEKRLPDVIFLDLIMPELDGFGFLEGLDRLIKENKHQWQSEVCKIVVLSSSVNDEEITRAAFNSYVYRYLVKPLKTESLSEFGL